MTKEYEIIIRKLNETICLVCIVLLDIYSAFGNFEVSQQAEATKT